MRAGRGNSTPLPDCASTVTWLKGDAKGHTTDEDKDNRGVEGAAVVFFRAAIIIPVLSLSYAVTPVVVKGRMVLESVCAEEGGRAQEEGAGSTYCSTEEFTHKSTHTPPPSSPP